MFVLLTTYQNPSLFTRHLFCLFTSNRNEVFTIERNVVSCCFIYDLGSECLIFPALFKFKFQIYDVTTFQNILIYLQCRGFPPEPVPLFFPHSSPWDFSWFMRYLWDFWDFFRYFFHLKKIIFSGAHTRF